MFIRVSPTGLFYPAEEITSFSALDQYVFCQRRCALMHVEGIWSDNEHTAKGTIQHKNADERGARSEMPAALPPLYCEKYGLNGKADIVEVRADELIPVEYKKGEKREFDSDNIQLAVQALCLEEMFQTEIKRGFIYHAASKRRREALYGRSLSLSLSLSLRRRSKGERCSTPHAVSQS